MPGTDLLAKAETSSESGSDTEREGRKRRHEGGSERQPRKEDKRRHKKEKKRAKTDGKLASLDARARAAGPRGPKPQLHFSWAEDAERTGRNETDCIDIREESDNLVFEKPYLTNIPAFRRVVPRWSRVRTVQDDSLQTDPRQAKRRRFTTKRAKALEADKEMPRLRLAREASALQQAMAPRISLPQPTFIPLVSQEAEASQPPASDFEQLRQRTAQLNRGTMDHPESLEAWLDFAAFQDTFFGNRLQRDAAEKKVDILQKALRHHHGSDELLLQLLQAAAVFQNEEDVKARWQGMLGDVGLSRSWRLWQEYISWLKSDVLGRLSSSLTVRHVQQAYNQALRAVARGRLQLLQEQKAQEAREAESALMDLLVAACQFDLQAGYTELAVARIQAALEFVVLAPAWSTAVPGPGGDAVRKPLFEQFWNSGAPLIGEDGCVGWQEWAITQQNTRLQPPLPPEPAEEEEGGGWTGWMDLDIPAPEPPATEEEVGSDADADAVGDEEEDDLELQQRELEELLQAEAAKLQGGPVGQELVEEWLRWERFKERREWQPQRLASSSTDAEGGEEEGGLAGRLVKFEDVEPGLFSLVVEGNQRALACRLLGVLDAPLGRWQSSNSRSALSDGNATASLAPELARALLHRQGARGDESDVEAVDPSCAWLSPDWMSAGTGAPLISETGVLPWYQADPSRRHFLLALLATLLRRSQLAEDAVLCEALVSVAAARTLESRQPTGSEELEDEGGGLPLAVLEDTGNKADVQVAQHDPAVAVREAVSELLRHQSQGSPLWTAYASYEARAGSIKKARRTFSMHLSNATASRDGAASSAAPLVLAFATAEMERRAADYRAVAAHSLCWLATSSAAPFQPLDEKESGPLQESRVSETRKGFQCWLLRMGAGAAPTQDQGAVIAAAALFEQIVDQARGAASSARLLRNAISRFPTEVRRDSAVLEQLTEEQCRLLVSASTVGAVTPREARAGLDEALQVYPRSVAIMQLLVGVQQRAFMVSQLRLRLGMACEDNPSAALWLLAAKLEASQVLAHHRMQQVFRRAEKHQQLDRSPLWRRAQLSYAAWRDAAHLDILFSRVSGKCPWVKEMWIDGFQRLEERQLMLGEAEKKEIRMRTSLESVVLSLASKRIMD